MLTGKVRISVQFSGVAGNVEVGAKLKFIELSISVSTEFFESPTKFGKLSGDFGRMIQESSKLKRLIA